MPLEQSDNECSRHSPREALILLLGHLNRPLPISSNSIHGKQGSDVQGAPLKTCTG